MKERELLIQYLEKKRNKEDKAVSLEEAKKELDTAERKLMEHLEGIGAESTSSYDGYGSAALTKPRLYASCTTENLPKLKDYLRKCKRLDILKETVAPQTLSAFTAELVEAGKEIPPFIGYYLKQGLRSVK